jgi:hypothetical protein
VKVFGEQYEAMVEGSETALHLETPDSLSQAAHSMRDCFQQLLEELAPSKIVKANLGLRLLKERQEEFLGAHA